MADLRQRNAVPADRDIEMVHMRGGSGGEPHGPVASGGHNGGASEKPVKKHRIPRHIHEQGESGRSGIHPIHFFTVCWRSSNTVSKWVNVLWPFVPVAIALHFYERNSHREDLSVYTFAFNYVAMVPAANLLGFAGQNLAWKLPKVFGELLSLDVLRGVGAKHRRSC